MGLRTFLSTAAVTLRRKVYEFATSANKRPLIDESLSELEKQIDTALARRNISTLVEISKELEYRSSNPAYVSQLKARAISGIELLVKTKSNAASGVGAAIAVPANTPTKAKKAEPGVVESISTIKSVDDQSIPQKESNKNEEDIESKKESYQPKAIHINAIIEEAASESELEEITETPSVAQIAEDEQRLTKEDQRNSSPEIKITSVPQATVQGEERAEVVIDRLAMTDEEAGTWQQEEPALTPLLPPITSLKADWLENEDSHQEIKEIKKDNELITGNLTEESVGEDIEEIEIEVRDFEIVDRAVDADDGLREENEIEAHDEPLTAETIALAPTPIVPARPSDQRAVAPEDRTSKIDRVWERRLERDLQRMAAKDRKLAEDAEQEIEAVVNDEQINNDQSQLEQLEANIALVAPDKVDDYQEEIDFAEEPEDEDETDSLPFGQYKLNPDWRSWSEEEWNYNLLRYCFIDNANNGANYGIPSSEEDLRYVIGDDQASSTEIAEALTTTILARATRHGKRPGLLCKQRVERWNPQGNTEPPFFAFLWSTCMISQGYPNPNEVGEFHARYERVYGFQEKINCQALVPAWEMLTHWLERDDIFPSESHRRLVLPSTIDTNKRNISHSWKLSFPRRSDRSVLSVALEDLLDQGISLESITTDIVRYIRDSGGFSPEFNKLLNEQLKYVESGLKLEEWVENLIQREIQCLIEVDKDQRTRNSEIRAYTSDQLTLRVDVDDPGSIYLALPKQRVDEPSLKDNNVKYCIIDPAGEEFLADTKRGLLLINDDIYVLAKSIQEEWIWRLRIGSLSGSTIKKWRCHGLTDDVPILCFCPLSGQRLSAFHLSTVGQEALVFVPKTYSFKPSDDTDIIEKYSWPSINGFQGFHLEKSVPSTSLVFTSSTEDQAELSIPWSSSSSEKPRLTGPLIRNRKLTYATAPTLWLPPSEQPTTVELSIRDLQSKQVTTEDTIYIDASDKWHKHELSLYLTDPGRYAVRTSVARQSSDLPLKWRENLLIAEPAAIDDGCPQQIAIEHQLFDNTQTLELEDFTPHYFDSQDKFWLSDWILSCLWPFEPVTIEIYGGGQSHKTTSVASPDGSMRVTTGEFRYALPDGVNSFQLSVHPQGMRSPIKLSLFGTQEERPQEGEHIPEQEDLELSTLAKNRFSCMVVLSSLNYNGQLNNSESTIKRIKTFVDKMTRERNGELISSGDIEIGSADTNAWIIISRNELKDEVQRLVDNVQKEVPFRITLGRFKRHGS